MSLKVLIITSFIMFRKKLFSVDKYSSISFLKPNRALGTPKVCIPFFGYSISAIYDADPAPRRVRAGPALARREPAARTNSQTGTGSLARMIRVMLVKTDGENKRPLRGTSKFTSES